MNDAMETHANSFAIGPTGNIASRWLAALLLCGAAAAQTYPTNRPRQVHPSVAPPPMEDYGKVFIAGALMNHMNGPLPVPVFQFPDGKWNHGEGFVNGTNPEDDEDTGGWHGLYQSGSIDAADVHGSPFNNDYGEHWQSYTHQSDPARATFTGIMRRFVGYLRPAGIPLPSTHPKYGDLATPYVDQGAFEMFAPATAWNGTDPIVLFYVEDATIVFAPKELVPGTTDLVAYYRPHRYLGYFSPDGLPRDEKAPGDAQAFLTNTEQGTMRTKGYETPLLWEQSSASQPFYPISIVSTKTMVQRQTELVFQRALQTIEAAKIVLSTQGLSPFSEQQRPSLTDLEANSRVIAIGASNGGLQSYHLGILRPDVVDGVFSTVIGQGLSRLMAEQELGYLTSRMSGFSTLGAVISPYETRDWGHFAWQRGFNIQDFSVTKRFFRGETHLPMLAFIGDEDITSTGTMWIAQLTGNNFQRSGKVGQTNKEIAWMSSDKRCHEGGDHVNPYTNATMMYEFDSVLDVAAAAVRNPKYTGAVPPFQPLARTSETRQYDEPAEWALAREWTEPTHNATTDPLVYDDAWNNAVQPDATGAWPGSEGSMLIRDQAVYVGSAEGIVSRFVVAESTDSFQQLSRTNQTKPLSYHVRGMTAIGTGATWQLLVATRRYLWKLDPLTLDVIAQSPIITWNCSKPHHLVTVDLNNDQQDEIVFAAEHGGLVVYDNNLQFVYELTDPGIKDFVVTNAAYAGTAQQPSITLLHERGLLVNITLAPSTGPSAYTPTLRAASAPQDGFPRALELVDLSFGGFHCEMVAALYNGDERGLSVRMFDPMTMACFGDVANVQNMTPNGVTVGGMLEMTSVKHQVGSDVGDHLLVLESDKLILFNEFAQSVGSVALSQIAGGNSTTMAMSVSGVAVGDLTPGGSGRYSEEVVIATSSGRLLWMHVADITNGALPIEYALNTGRGSADQYRTNRTLPCAWAMAMKPGENDKIHFLDHGGAHWTVNENGMRELVSASLLASRDKQQWGWMGTSGGAILGAPVQVGFSSIPGSTNTSLVTSTPFMPKNGRLAHFETTNNWEQEPTNPFEIQKLLLLDGFGVMPLGGAVAHDPASGTLLYRWLTGSFNHGGWPNMIDGYGLSSAGTLQRYWASSDDETGGGGNTNYLDFRSSDNFVPYMNLQSVRPLLVSGETYATHGPWLVVTTPGGRVRIVSCYEWMKNTAPVNPNRNGIGFESATSRDLGHGIAALDVHESATHWDIYVGTFATHHCRGNYATVGGISPEILTSPEVTRGAVHSFRLDKQPANETSEALMETGKIDLMPNFSTGERGGLGVVGLLRGDVVLSNPGDELVVTTVTGDLIVYGLNGPLGSSPPLYRTWLPGSLGCYNSIILADLDGVGANELYVAGSTGLHRFLLQ